MEAPKDIEGAGETTQLAHDDGHDHGHGGDGGTCGKVKAVMQEYNLPLILGVVVALLAANLAYDPYHAFWHTQWGHIYIFGHKLSGHFVINDIGMAFHFAIATKEIVEACLPGGSLNPPSKALNPIVSTLGGVFGPVGFYFLFAAVFQATDSFPCPDTDFGCVGTGVAVGDGAAHRRLAVASGAATPSVFDATTCGQDGYSCSNFGCNFTSVVSHSNTSHAAALGDYFPAGVVFNGWGISTATDIVLAWMIGKRVFGNGHPAIPFLLLLAVADDALGIVIIAIFYPDPHHPAQPQWLGLVILGVLVGLLFRKMKVGHWSLYILIPGTLSWIGFIKSALHPALALVPIVPLLPCVRCPSWYGEWSMSETEAPPEMIEDHKDVKSGDFMQSKMRLTAYTSRAFDMGKLQTLLTPKSSTTKIARASKWRMAKSSVVNQIRIDALSKITIFKHLKKHLLHELVGLMDEAKFSEGESMYKKGERLDAMYVIVAGEFKGAHDKAHGKGDYFGEFAIMDTDDAAEHDITASADGTMCLKLDKSKLAQMSKDLKDDIDIMAENFKQVLMAAMSKFEHDEADFHASPLHKFEHEIAFYVDMMLGFFAFANAGVVLDGAGAMTAVVAGSLLVGKTVGIVMAGGFAHIFLNKWAPLPQGVSMTDLFCVGITASIGLTVALFVSAEAFADHPTLLRDANLGALLSMFFSIPAMIAGKLLGVHNGEYGHSSGNAHDAADELEAQERREVALAEAAEAAELAADRALIMDSVDTMNDTQVRELLMRFMHEMSTRVQTIDKEQLEEKPNSYINSMMFSTFEETKTVVLGGSSPSSSAGGSPMKLTLPAPVRNALSAPAAVTASTPGSSSSSDSSEPLMAGRVAKKIGFRNEFREFHCKVMAAKGGSPAQLILQLDGPGGDVVTEMNLVPGTFVGDSALSSDEVGDLLEVRPDGEATPRGEGAACHLRCIDGSKEQWIAAIKKAM